MQPFTFARGVSGARRLRRRRMSSDRPLYMRGRRPARVLLLSGVVLAAALITGVVSAAPADLDPTFGSGGMVQAQSAPELVIQPDGKIFAGPVRYNPDGTIDTSFGIGGSVSGGGEAVLLQPDGRIVFRTGSGLSRSNPDGSLDTSFGTGGRVTLDFVASAVLLQPDGKLVGIGSIGQRNFALVRYNSDGSIDTSFGDAGKVTTGFASPVPEFPSQARATAGILQRDGKIVVGGTLAPDTTDCCPPQRHAVLSRYHPNGSLDASFGSGGILHFWSLFAYDHKGADPTDLALDKDGKIIVENDWKFARLHDDGSLAAEGVFRHPDGWSSQFDQGAESLTVQPDGKIVAVGYVTIDPGSGQKGAIVRLNPDLSLDTSFSDDGFLITANGTENAVLIQPDGKIVTSGSTYLSRYLGDSATHVSIDVSPGNAQNKINLPKGNIRVAILSTADFDATTIDPSTVCFGDADAPLERNCSYAHHKADVKDVNADGSPDLILHFETAQTGIDPGDTTACLTGTTRGGLPVDGCDLISTR